MTAGAAAPVHRPATAGECAYCGFQLWAPFARLRVSSAGLYDDSRFPGRCLLSLDEHYTDLLDVPDDVAAAYLADLRDLRTAIQKVTGAVRVNYAVLGNAEPHVHWHVIPRFPNEEPLPNRSPWNDPRPQTKLRRQQRTQLLTDLGSCLG